MQTDKDPWNDFLIELYIYSDDGYNYTHLYTTHVRPDICCIKMMNIHPAFVRDIIMIYLSRCHATAKIHNTELTISLLYGHVWTTLLLN